MNKMALKIYKTNDVSWQVDFRQSRKLSDCNWLYSCLGPNEITIYDYMSRTHKVFNNNVCRRSLINLIQHEINKRYMYKKLEPNETKTKYKLEVGSVV
jgi:hypothetical protein